MPVAPLSPEDRAAIIAEATRRNPQNPELALFQYAQQNNLPLNDVDTYMGWAPGTSQQWAVRNGQMPAPQGNFNAGGQYTMGQAAPTPAAPTPAAPTPAAPTPAAPTPRPAAPTPPAAPPYTMGQAAPGATPPTAPGAGGVPPAQRALLDRARALAQRRAATPQPRGVAATPTQRFQPQQPAGVPTIQQPSLQQS